MTSADVQRLKEALDGVHEARARLEEMLTSGAAGDLLELHATVLSTVKRLLREMDLDQRIRRQVRLLPRSHPRLPYSGVRPHPGARRPAAPTPEWTEPTPEDETQVLPTIPDDRRERRRRDR